MYTSPLVALLTDYGTADAFTGILKGVLAQIAPGLPFADLTHEIPPGDIQRAAILLWQARPYFPTGTVFLCVIDPGVGTDRRGLVVESAGQFFVGPDNGIFTFVLQDLFHAWELSNPDLALPNPSLTFHGRDIFAPAAAHLALGSRAHQFGPPVKDPARLPLPRLEFLPPDAIQGEIMTIDRFGNLLTSLGKFERLPGGLIEFNPWLEGLAAVQMPPGMRSLFPFKAQNSTLEIPGGVRLSWASNFAEIPDEHCAVLLGSTGLLEIAANRRSATGLLDLRSGEAVTLRIQGEHHV